jgi:hypothetical protein
MNFNYKSLAFLFFLLTTFLFSACSNTRFLKDGEVLYTGITKIDYADKVHLKEVRDADEIVGSITFYKPNNSLFLSKRVLPPIGLWTYNYLKPKKEGKKGGWVYRNFKKDPILISTVNPELHCKKLEAALFSEGFLNVKSSYVLKPKRNNPKKAKITYRLELNPPFTIHKIINPEPCDSIDHFINEYLQDIPLRPGDVFNFEKINIEKRSLASKLTEKGYYFFGASNVEFIADTNAVVGQIDLLVRKSKVVPGFVLKKYTIDTVEVRFVDLKIDSNKLTPVDTLHFDGISIIGSNGYLNPEVIRHAVQFKTGDYYATSRHQGTIKQFNNYGVFRNVKVSFLLSDSIAAKLNLIVEVSTKDNVSLNIEGYVQDKSTGFIGPGMEVALAHGNIG